MIDFETIAAGRDVDYHGWTFRRINFLPLRVALDIEKRRDELTPVDVLVMCAAEAGCEVERDTLLDDMSAFEANAIFEELSNPVSLGESEA